MIAQTSYTVSPARYAKRMFIVRCPSQDGFKTRAARLASSIARCRWTNREGGYVLSCRARDRFELLYAQGCDATIMGNLMPPTS